MRVCFVVNPAAGRGRAKKVWEALRQHLKGREGWDVHFTAGPGDATRLARAAVDRGFERVAAVGGDGTMCEVVNGLIGTSAAMAVIPAGTANDFILTAGIPRRPEDAADLALSGPERAVDVGQLNGNRYFINIAGAGFDAEVSRRVNRWPKYFGGTIPYLAGIVGTLWSFSPVEMVVEADEQHFEGKVFMVAVGITQYYGGGMKILPDARDDDGLFDICLVGDVGKVETLQTVPKIYKGGHVTHPKVTMLRARRVTLRSQLPVAIHTDGELLGELPADFEVLPGALRVVTAPRGA